MTLKNVSTWNLDNPTQVNSKSEDVSGVMSGCANWGAYAAQPGGLYERYKLNSVRCKIYYPVV